MRALIATLLISGGLATISGTSLVTGLLDAETRGNACIRPATATETAVCSSPDLARLDAESAALLARMMARADVRTQERWGRLHGRFLDERDGCGSDIGCLRLVYADHVALLTMADSRLGQGEPD